MFAKYAKYYDLIYLDKDYKKEAEMVYNWAKKPKTILSLGCGTGKHARWWSKKTIVVGIDSSKEMIKEARKSVPNVCFYNRKIEDDKWKKSFSFDCVTAMFNVMGYLPDFNFEIPVKKGGYFIFDCWDYHKILRNPPVIRRKVFGKYSRIALPTSLSRWKIMIEYFILKGDECVVYERHIVCGYKGSYLIEKLGEKGFKYIASKPGPGWSKWYKFRKL